MGLSEAKNALLDKENIFRSLLWRRYLIMLDDVWNWEAWDNLKVLFPHDDDSGSRIIFTTRLLDVASYVDPSVSPHVMDLMNEDFSWDLLRKRIFGDEPCPSELASVGRTIATSCSGLPLAIVVISGLLVVGRGKTVDQKTVALWEKIAKNVKSAISENEGSLIICSISQFLLLILHFHISFSLQTVEEMAYAAVASLSHTIHLILNHHEGSISPQFKDQITSLHKHIIFLQSFLEDDPGRANNWEETIREVTDRAEDIIELLLSDLLLESKSKLSKEKRKLPYDCDELERVTEEIALIANGVKGGRRTEAVGGYEKELRGIISLLCRDDSKFPAQTYSIAIVGSGGSGKTTLARNAYNHPSIVEHFDIRAWATISTDYSPRKMTGTGNSSNSEDDLIKSVKTILRGKRYLIVLDDVWSLGPLNALKFILDFNSGSRIIFTTRSLELAKWSWQVARWLLFRRRRWCGSAVFRIRCLDEDKTWNLLNAKIFKGDPCPSQLEYIGKMIAKGCRGHPLSVEVVSGILAVDQTKAMWEDILDDMNAAPEDDDEVVRILSLGYTHLPHHLRSCFLYLGIFPKSHEIHVSKLIKLWVAEGFLSETEFKSFEETGEEHVEDLVRRGLVSVTKRKSNGRIMCIAVHDLMRDLCLRQARIDKFVLDVQSFFGVGQHPEAMKLQWCRRVCTSPYGNDFLEGIYGSTIRTIILSLDDSELGFKCSIGNVRLLRILDLSNAYTYDLPNEVFELFHLRYLAFNCGFSISEAISNLENLQTLIICPRENDGKIFSKLPEGIWRMPQLRHLLLFRSELPNQEGATSTLENLQTLSGVADFKCSRENLKMISNLKKLALLYIKNMTDLVEDYELHNLVHLRNLEILKIEMDRCFMEQHKISSCAFPPTLKKLSLSNMGLSWEDMGIVASLPNLQVLKLRNHACIGETWETSDGGFFELTFLLIEESSLEHWITKSSHFPKLKCLVLHWCMYLVEVPNDIGGMPTLELIQLDKQNDVLLSSAKRIQKDRQHCGDHHLQVQVV